MTISNYTDWSAEIDSQDRIIRLHLIKPDVLTSALEGYRPIKFARTKLWVSRLLRSLGGR